MWCAAILALARRDRRDRRPARARRRSGAGRAHSLDELAALVFPLPCDGDGRGER